jgi:hypothetical protein
MPRVVQKKTLTSPQCSDLTSIFIGMPRCLLCRGCQGASFLWFLCTFHLTMAPVNLVEQNFIGARIKSD